MAFRTVEISNPAEIHIKNSQLQIEQENGTATIPIEDIATIFCVGPNIRISTMALSRLSQNKVTLITLDNKYLPTSLILPYEGNSRQSQIMHKQISLTTQKKLKIWIEIIKRKISNQARCLAILGIDGADEVISHMLDINDENVDFKESYAAKIYFEHFYPGLNRKTETPINSRLNYGYAVIRSAIARSITATGFHPTFGFHHNSQLNPFNLVDDLIEPWRPFVDLIAISTLGTSIKLNKHDRYQLAHVLHNACIINEQKMTILSAIDIMSESVKRFIMDEDKSLIFPTLLPIENMELISE